MVMWFIIVLLENLMVHVTVMMMTGETERTAGIVVALPNTRCTA